MTLMSKYRRHYTAFGTSIILIGKYGIQQVQFYFVCYSQLYWWDFLL